MQMMIFKLLRLRSLRLMWNKHMYKIREWRHPLRNSLLEREESALERLTNFWMMHMRMWEHPLLNGDIGGHQRGTLDT